MGSVQGQSQQTTSATAGTVGEDVKTVHDIRDGRPKCGAAGDVTEWLRRVNCDDCLDGGRNRYDL